MITEFWKKAALTPRKTQLRRARNVERLWMRQAFRMSVNDRRTAISLISSATGHIKYLPLQKPGGTGYQLVGWNGRRTCETRESTTHLRARVRAPTPPAIMHASARITHCFRNTKTTREERVRHVIKGTIPGARARQFHFNTTSYVTWMTGASTHAHVRARYERRRT